MIVEDERDEDVVDFNYDTIDENASTSLSHEIIDELTTFIQKLYEIRGRKSHFQLQADLFEHLWQINGA